jgi:hypothetical protein
MAENKKSFLLYCDLIHTVSQMPNDKAGELFKHILEYVNDKNPNSDDLLIKLTFEPIKQSLKRDLVKYENIINRNKVNGLKGGRPQKPKEPIGLIGNPTKPKKADSDSDSVNDSVSDILLKKETKVNIPKFSEFLIYALEKEPTIKENSLKNKYDAWIEAGWKNGHGKKIVNWKSNLLNTLQFIEKTNGKTNITDNIDFQKTVESIRNGNVRR